MRLTTKGRYAVTAMLDIAIQYKKGPTSLAEISARQEISLSYLEQLFAKLRKRGLVTSIRGPGGGYELSDSPDVINIAAIIDAVDEPIDATRCGGSANCCNGKACLTHDLWVDLTERIHDFLANISLSDIIKRNRNVTNSPLLKDNLILTTTLAPETLGSASVQSD